MDSFTSIRQRVPRVSPGFVDAVIATGLTLFIQAYGAGFLQVDASFQGSTLSAATALLMTIPLFWRRRYPLLVFTIMLVGMIATFTGGVTSHPPLVWASIIALVIAAYSVGAYSRHRLISVVGLLATATLIVLAFGGGVPAPPNNLVPFVILLLPWLVGQALRNRELRADAFRERAIRLEQEQAFATQAALAAERARIARELHDVVTHNVSVMVVQAGAARTVLDPPQTEVTQALLAIEASGREAMTELRNLLGLWSEESHEIRLAPQPSIDDVRSLVRRVQEASLPVELRVEGAPRPVPAGINLTAYRIIQEALTNAIKYSGLARTQVILDYRESELKLEVLDEGPNCTADVGDTRGHGLAGMRERVALYGGRLEAGPRLERGYAVRAWLPLTADEG